MSDTPIITYEQIMKMFRASARASAKRMAEMDKRHAEMELAFEKSRAEFDRRSKAFDQRLQMISEQCGGLGNSLGSYAEWCFRYALTDSQELAGIHFDSVFGSGQLTRGGVQDEFDIVMVNGEYVALIEVKFTVREKDLDKLLTVKLEHFRFLYPEYAKHKLLLALAGEVFSDEMLRKVQDSGVIAVKEKPGAAEVFADKMRTF